MSDRIRPAEAVKITAISNCIAIVHSRLVPNRSSTGVHSGLNAHGIAIRLVHNPTSRLSMPSDLNRITDTVATIAYGPPSAKNAVGIHSHGFVFFSGTVFSLFYSFLFAQSRGTRRPRSPEASHRGSLPF